MLKNATEQSKISVRLLEKAEYDDKLVKGALIIGLFSFSLVMIQAIRFIWDYIKKIKIEKEEREHQHFSMHCQ